MKEMNLDVLKDAAHRLLFDTTEEELATLLGECSTLMKQMEAMGQIDGLDEYEPMTFPFPCEIDELREDEPCEPLTPEEALSNAGSTFENQIKLPKVVG